MLYGILKLNLKRKPSHASTQSNYCDIQHRLSSCTIICVHNDDNNNNKKKKNIILLLYHYYIISCFYIIIILYKFLAAVIIFYSTTQTATSEQKGTHVRRFLLLRALCVHTGNEFHLTGTQRPLRYYEAFMHPPRVRTGDRGMIQV